MTQTIRPPARPSGRRVLDIEDALQWAYRDELPKRGATAAASSTSWLPLLGTPIDNWSHEPGYPAAMGEPHPDALVIATHVQRLARFAGASVEDLGISLGGALTEAVDLPRVIAYAADRMVNEVIVAARLRRRPVWPEERPRLVPVVGGNGRIKMVRDVVLAQRDRQGNPLPPITVQMPCGALKNGSYPQGARPVLVWDQDPASWAIERALYLAWWHGLATLAEELAGSLASVAVLPPSAPRHPWAGQVDLGKPRDLFAGLRQTPHVRQTRGAAEAARKRGARRERPRTGMTARRAPLAMRNGKEVC